MFPNTNYNKQNAVRESICFFYFKLIFVYLDFQLQIHPTIFLGIEHYIYSFISFQTTTLSTLKVNNCYKTVL